MHQRIELRAGLRGLFTRALYRYLAAYAPSPVEMLIGRRALQDISRHIAYAMQHLRYAVTHVSGTDRNFNLGLSQAELVVGRDEEDPVLWEALACVFGGGVRGMDAGMNVVARLRRDYVRDYIARLAWVGVDRRPFLSENFKQVLEEGDK